MAEEAKPKDEEGEGEGDGAGKGSPLPWILVTLLCGGMGMAIPYFMPTGGGDGAAEEQTEPVFEMLDPEDTAFVPFDAVVVNLDEGQLTRYLQVAVTLQVPKEEEESIKLKIEEKKAVLKNWLINQISDKNREEIRGGAGQDRLRREVRDQFNSVLFPDGYDRIYNVLFDEYNVQ
ncbi:MAG: flagellar basal body-associated FliL family protein [Fuerstiella sp.]